MTTRRNFINALLLSAPLLTAACKKSSSAAKPPEQGGQTLIHTFGLPQTPQSFRKLYAAGPPAEVLLFALAPERLVGWTSRKSAETLAFLPENTHAWPLLGSINGRGSTVSFERLLAEQVELVVDAGTLNDTYLSTAEKTAAQLNIPYLLIDGRLNQAAEQIRQLGGLLQSPYTGTLAELAEQALVFAESRRRGNHGHKIYYARGADGFETGMAQSIHTEVIKLLGADNIAASLGHGGLGKVSMEQLIWWQPETILTQDEHFFRSLADDSRIWSNLDAVKNKQVYLFPKLPFGWLDGPPGINRLLGIYVLQAVLAQQSADIYRQQIHTLFGALYHSKPPEGVFDIVKLGD